jgi:hypothetical protein
LTKDLKKKLIILLFDPNVISFWKRNAHKKRQTGRSSNVLPKSVLKRNQTLLVLGEISVTLLTTWTFHRVVSINTDIDGLKGSPFGKVARLFVQQIKRKIPTQRINPRKKTFEFAHCNSAKYFRLRFSGNGIR